MTTSRDDERRPPPSQEDAGFAPVVGQMLFMPLTVMMYGLNLLARTARGSLPVSGSDEPRPLPPRQPDPARDPPPVAPPPGWSTLEPGWRRPNLELVHSDRNQPATPPAPRNPEGREPRGSEEHTRMNDNKNLQDDMLKTVRYWISFEKRDYEAVLHDGIDHVYDNLTDAQFTAWKMAEFMQQLKASKIDVPFLWQGKGKRAFYTVDASGKFLTDFEHKDKKYLTVDWEVVGRVVRRKARFDERKTEALEDIADRLKNCCGDIDVTVATED